MSGARQNLRQIISFILVGATSTGMYFLLLWALRGSISSTMLLTACCYGISMVYNYILQSWVTFRSGPPTRRSMSRFVVMHLGAMALNSLLMAGLVDGLLLPLYLTQVVVTLFISAMIFVVSKYWVFQA